MVFAASASGGDLSALLTYLLTAAALGFPPSAAFSLLTYLLTARSLGFILLLPVHCLLTYLLTAAALGFPLLLPVDLKMAYLLTYLLTYLRLRLWVFSLG